MMACRKQKRVSGGNEGLALDIAHYNYELRFRSCGLFRGTQGFALRTYKALPLTRLGSAPKPRQGLSALCNLTRE